MKNILLLLMLLPCVLFAQTVETTTKAVIRPKTQTILITVGGTEADIPGHTNADIQMAFDALPEEGGTVKMNPGLFTISAPVRIPSNCRLLGSGSETILKRIDGFHSKFIVDADFGELKLTVENPSGFETGMSIQVTNDQYNSCWDVSTGVITDIVGNVLYIDSHLIRDYDSEKNGMVTNAGSCISAIADDENVFVSNLTIDGNKAKNDLLDGCNGAGIAIIRSKDVTVEKVHVMDFNGEGITWQITENVTVRNSEISGCTNMGLHPGTGSPIPLLKGITAMIIK